jgi:thiamine monophosphate synthase
MDRFAAVRHIIRIPILAIGGINLAKCGNAAAGFLCYNLLNTA